MNNPLHSIRFGFIAFSIIIFGIQGCSENSIPTSFGDPELETGVINLAVNVTQKESIQPDMGLKQNLYLGKSSYSEADLILLRFADRTRGNLELYSLDDSSSIGKRKPIDGTFRLSVSDTLNSAASFELLKVIKDDGDTLFWETRSSSQDVDINGAGLTTEVLGVSQISSVLYPDSSFRNALEFPLDTAYISWLTDSLNYANGIYLAVRTVAPENDLLTFHSRLSNIETQPVIYIDYEREGGADSLEFDTLTAYISVEENLTLVTPDPGLFPVVPVGSYTIGTNLGTALEIRIDINRSNFPSQVLISDAELTFGFDDASINGNNSFRTVGVSLFGDENETVSGSFATNVNDSLKTISVRDFIQRYASGNIDSLEGLFLYPSITMDPFSHILINSISDSLRIEYVYPE